MFDSVAGFNNPEDQPSAGAETEYQDEQADDEGACGDIVCRCIRDATVLQVQYKADAED